ncbi:alpha/beta hydrolase [Streptomyces globosus]|uniref:Alpha/beta hydrolase n=1 Tax=Streptomyces globosus TaxID=68209 RepID=A0A344U1B0_9ACTN|nr:alpha/beta hydrolase [Streptomyces globosus]AXE24681.1 alpha/beta hydrolase [Streptomyces globosus]
MPWCPPHTRRVRGGAVVGCLLLPCVLTGLTAASVTVAAHTDPASPSPTASARPAGRDVNGLVDIGGGRKIYATCKGQSQGGSPTVVLIAGKGNGADDWMSVLDPADPAHAAPGDDLPWRNTGIRRSDDSVFSQVSRFTRVCTYDRPDVRTTGTDISTPRPQPHTVDADVHDLGALLTSLGEPGPYVLVAHSYGGLIATLYARTHPQNVAGLVMVDTVTERIAEVASPGAVKNWDASNAKTSQQSREGVRLLDAFRKINATGPPPAVPAVVLSADKPWRVDLLPAEARKGEQVTFEDWLASQQRLSTALGARAHVTNTRSGHDIYLYQPRTVTCAIRDIVGASS